MLIITSANCRIYSQTAETGKSVSMRQALAYLAQRRPMAKPLPKRRARR
jgi:hypothetical protein